VVRALRLMSMAHVVDWEMLVVVRRHRMLLRHVVITILLRHEWTRRDVLMFLALVNTMRSMACVAIWDVEFSRLFSSSCCAGEAACCEGGTIEVRESGLAVRAVTWVPAWWC
jgi:hypothetical protein